MAGANVQVTGIQRTMGGLKESMTAFRKHHAEVADALLNISGVGTDGGQMVDKDEARKPYEHKEWPRMAYHADGREEVCVTPADFNALRPKGFRMEPYPKVQVALADPKSEKAELQRQLAEKDGKIATLAERMDRLQELLEQQASKKG